MNSLLVNQNYGHLGARGRLFSGFGGNMGGIPPYGCHCAAQPLLPATTPGPHALLPSCSYANALPVQYPRPLVAQNSSDVAQNYRPFNPPQAPSQKKCQRRRKRFYRLRPYSFNDDTHVGTTRTRRRSHNYDSRSGQPQAPNNTTQFLIHDREEREQDKASPPPVPAPRQRCYSFCAQGPPFYVDSSDEESDTDDDTEREFDEAYRAVKIERIASMSRDEVNREVLEFESDNRHLINRLINMKSENRRLKQLLDANGVKYDNDCCRHHRSLSLGTDAMLSKP